jgi:stage III sporulation protein AB
MVNMEISYRKEPLPDIFRRLSSYKKSVAADIMNKCISKLDSEQNVGECWCTAVDEVLTNSCLTNQDTLILKDFGQQLGKNSVQGHADMFRLMEEKISHQIKEANTLKNTKGRIYSGLGFSIGIIISVLMI